MDTKFCTGCQKHKSLTNFGYNRAAKDGRTHRCKTCNNAYAIEQRRKRGILGPRIYRWQDKPVPNVKTCTRCKIAKPLDEFEKRTDDKGLYGCKSRCRSCEQARRAGYIDSYRRTCLIYYSEDPPSCACCGETTFEFLCIDHINGGGSKHAKEIGRGKIYRWLIQNNFPEGFRVLCHNCNLSLGYYGYCPHKNNASQDGLSNAV